MRNRTFLKRLSAVLFAIAMFCGLLFTLTSCEDPKPDCEVYGYGWAEVENATGYTGYVDATYTVNGVNYEARVSSGSSYEYKMDAGKIYIWFSFDGDDWVYDTYYLDPCEELVYTWYLDKKKSTGTGLYLEISTSGEVIKTVTEFKTLKR